MLSNFLNKSLENYSWIVFFRISAGLFIFLHFLIIEKDFELLYSINGILPSDVSSYQTPKGVITIFQIQEFLSFYGIPLLYIINGFKMLFFSFSLFLIFGWFPRLSSIILLFMQISLAKGGILFSYGVDFFISLTLFYLIMIPSNFKYVLFNFRVRKRDFPDIYRRIFQIHIGIIYFSSGLDKALGVNWWNGESIWKAINLNFANRDFSFNFSWLADFPYFLTLMGITTIAIELFYPIFCINRRTRKFWICLTISMHLGIALVLNLYLFSSLMIIWNLAFYYSLQEKEGSANTIIRLQQIE